MKSRPIFLCASVPNRDPERYPADPVAIREAIRGVVAVALPFHPLVFGGHPAISPMVWEDAESMGLAGDLYIYHSQLFPWRVPLEAPLSRAPKPHRLGSGSTPGPTRSLRVLGPDAQDDDRPAQSSTLQACEDFPSTKPVSSSAGWRASRPSGICSGSATRKPPPS